MSDKNMLWEIADKSEGELNVMMYVQNNMDEVKRKFIEEYLEYIAEELRLKLENSKWKVSQNISDESGQNAWNKRCHKPIIVKRADNAIRAMLEFECAGYGSPYYGINTDIDPKIRFHADLLDALAKRNYKHYLSNSNWPISVYFEKTNWMSPDFIIRLHDFHKNRENSELGRVANTVVANMLDMMKTVDAVVLSQK